jgi:hypothetical protein
MNPSRKRYALLCALAFAACSPQPPAEPKPGAEVAGAPTTLKDLEAAHDWQHEGGEAVNKAWNDGVKAILSKMSRPDAIGAIKEAGFECIYGEAHETYPDPAAQCTRSFATRACQMDWEIFSTADKGMVDEVDGSFKRDCVGVADDWPDPIKSAIDDQLAPGPALPSTPAPH